MFVHFTAVDGSIVPINPNRVMYVQVGSFGSGQTGSMVIFETGTILALKESPSEISSKVYNAERYFWNQVISTLRGGA